MGNEAQTGNFRMSRLLYSPCQSLLTCLLIVLLCGGHVLHMHYFYLLKSLPKSVNVLSHIHLPAEKWQHMLNNNGTNSTTLATNVLLQIFTFLFDGILVQLYFPKLQLRGIPVQLVSVRDCGLRCSRVLAKLRVCSP